MQNLTYSCTKTPTTANWEANTGACVETPHPGGYRECDGGCGYQYQQATCDVSTATWVLGNFGDCSYHNFLWGAMHDASSGVGAWYDAYELANSEGYGPPVEIQATHEEQPCTCEQWKNNSCGYVFREVRSPYVVLNGCIGCYKIDY
jgi:hypothetical protein